jgi:hypothetical protein
MQFLKVAGFLGKRKKWKEGQDISYIEKIQEMEYSEYHWNLSGHF